MTVPSPLPPRCDIAIVGAGPAGAWAATCLAARGARVVVFDPSHPREKSCGGGVTGRALALVSRHLDTAQLPSVAITAARFVGGRRGASAVVRLPGQALAVASRQTFDGVLLAAAERAGASIHRTRVLDVKRTRHGMELTVDGYGSLTAGSVIGADGANSLVRRRMTRAFTRRQLSIATGYFAHGVTSSEIVLELVGDPPGYLWSFPRPDHLAVGICAQADTGASSEALRARTLAWIRRTGLGEGARLQPYAWPIPSLSADDFRSLPLAGPGWFTIGDAAGLVDPITREGIFFALESGSFAADALLSTRAQRERDYEDRVRDEIGADLARAARYKAGFFRPAFANLLIDAMVLSPRIREIVARLVAGTQSYRGLKWELVRTLEVGLAWRWLTERRTWDTPYVPSS